MGKMMESMSDANRQKHIMKNYRSHHKNVKYQHDPFDVL